MKPSESLHYHNQRVKFAQHFEMYGRTVISIQNVTRSSVVKNVILII